MYFVCLRIILPFLNKNASCCISVTYVIILNEQKSIKQSLEEPEFLMTDFGKFDRPAILHIAFQALHQYVKKNGHMPKPRCKVNFLIFLI